MKVHIIGGGNLGVSIALGLSKFASETKSQLRAETPLVYLEN
jgi:pyrroline-5-carboxylate reductase